MICYANQWTGFYIITAAVMKESKILMLKKQWIAIIYYKIIFGRDDTTQVKNLIFIVATLVEQVPKVKKIK